VTARGVTVVALRRRIALACVALAATAWAPACRQDMHDQAKYEPMERSGLFADQRAARPVPAGTVARGQLQVDEHYFTGKVGGRLAETFPAPVTRETLARGQERYDIFCSPCHDRTGSGRGMIVQRGFPRAASFHEKRLRESPPGHFFNAVTNGFGVMPSYRTQIPVDDRWAIVAYIRALQLSQHAALDDVEPLKRALLEEQGIADE
jgi:mono/diheme cytochrome c family protein